MRAVMRVTILLVAFALATLALSWWTIPIIGGLWGLVAAKETWPVTTAAAAAGLSWAVLLAWAAVGSPVFDLGNKVGAVMGLPGWGVFAITLLFPMVLAGSATVLAGSLRPKGKP
jgi:hypothetical protein